MFFPSNNYNFCNATFDLLPSEHLLAAERTEGCKSYVHWVLGNLESIPYLGRAVAYLDLLIAKVIDFFCNCFCSSKDPQPIFAEESDDEKELVEELTIENLLNKFPVKLHQPLINAIREADTSGEFLINLSSEDFTDPTICAIVEILGGILPQGVSFTIDLRPSQLYLLNERNTKNFGSLSICVGAAEDEDFRCLNAFSKRFVLEHTLVIKPDYENDDEREVERRFCTFLENFKGHSKSTLVLDIFYMTDNTANTISGFMRRESYNPLRFGLILTNPHEGTLALLPQDININELTVSYEFINSIMIQELLNLQHLSSLSIGGFTSNAPPLEEISLLAQLNRNVRLSIMLRNENYKMPTDLFDALKNHSINFLGVDCLTEEQYLYLASNFPLTTVSVAELSE